MPCKAERHAKQGGFIADTVIGSGPSQAAGGGHARPKVSADAFSDILLRRACRPPATDIKRATLGSGWPFCEERLIPAVLFRRIVCRKMRKERAAGGRPL